MRVLEDLLAQCERYHDALDEMFARMGVQTAMDAKPFLPSSSGRPWEAIQKGNELIRKTRVFLGLPRVKPVVPNEDVIDIDDVRRVLDNADQHGDFVQGEDGYTYYGPTNGNRGVLPSWALRVLAEEIDKRDATWHAIMNGDTAIGPGCVQVWKWDDAPAAWKKLSGHDGDEDWLALIPKALKATDEELWWMRWYPGEHVERHSEEEGAPHGFEIWIGAHA